MLVKEPAKLLQDLGMVGVAVENPPVGCLSRVELCIVSGSSVKNDGCTYILLLLMNVADLKPDIFLCERTRRVVDDVFEALGRSATSK